MELYRNNGHFEEKCLMRIRTGQPVRILLTENAPRMPVRLNHGGAELLDFSPTEPRLKWGVIAISPKDPPFTAFARHEPDVLLEFIAGDPVWEPVARKAVAFWATYR